MTRAGRSRSVARQPATAPTQSTANTPLEQLLANHPLATARSTAASLSHDDLDEREDSNEMDSHDASSTSAPSSPASPAVGAAASGRRSSSRSRPGANASATAARTGATSSSSTTTTSGSVPTIELVLKPDPNVSSFLTKLYNIVCDSHSNDMIRWTDDGESFVVLDSERLTHEIIPRFFKHNNYSSFVRQLNMYGFRKVTHILQGALNRDEPECTEFRSPNFIRGKPHLLEHVKRKASSRKAGAATGDGLALLDGAADSLDSFIATAGPTDAWGNLAVASAVAPSVLAADGVAKPAAAQQLVRNFDVVLRELTNIRQTQKKIEDELRTIRTENELIWRESQLQRTKHESQQAVINRILHFLASVFSADKTKGISGASPLNLAKFASGIVGEDLGPSAAAAAAGSSLGMPSARPTPRQPLLLRNVGNGQGLSHTGVIGMDNTASLVTPSITMLPDVGDTSSISTAAPLISPDLVQQQLLDYLARNPEIAMGNTAYGTSALPLALTTPSLELMENPLDVNGAKIVAQPQAMSNIAPLDHHQALPRLSQNIASLDESIQTMATNLGMDFSNLDPSAFDPAFVNEFLDLDPAGLSLGGDGNDAHGTSIVPFSDNGLDERSTSTSMEVLGTEMAARENEWMAGGSSDATKRAFEDERGTGGDKSASAEVEEDVLASLLTTTTTSPKKKARV